MPYFRITIFHKNIYKRYSQHSCRIAYDFRATQYSLNQRWRVWRFVALALNAILHALSSMDINIWKAFTHHVKCVVFYSVKWNHPFIYNMRRINYVILIDHFIWNSNRLKLLVCCPKHRLSLSEIILKIVSKKCIYFEVHFVISFIFFPIK